MPDRGFLRLPVRNRELALIALALLITTAGFAAVQLARAQEFSSSPLIAAVGTNNAARPVRSGRSSGKSCPINTVILLPVVIAWSCCEAIF